jgi:hypothetical protein
MDLDEDALLQQALAMSMAVSTLAQHRQQHICHAMVPIAMKGAAHGTPLLVACSWNVCE